MSKCDCDDGIGLWVCKKHSTPQNNPLHWMHTTKPIRRPEPEPEYREYCDYEDYGNYEGDDDE